MPPGTPETPETRGRPGHGRKVVVAMSGGVDSSVTAALLKQDGYEVVGCFMRLGSADTVDGPAAAGASEQDPSSCDPGARAANRQGCCSVNDAGDARLVAAMLDVPFYVLNFRRDFGRVMDYFVGEYNAGRTPNPCVRCNDWLRFGKLADYARSIDADVIASGHYARIDRPAAGGRARLLRGVDHHKDQSYVLFGTQRDQLGRMLLPIGRFHKPHVRQLAQQFGLPVFDKPDSYEICFVPDNDYRGFIARHSPEAMSPGVMLDTEGNVVAEHEGHQHFTIGQRRGLSVAAGRPLYVVDKDPAANTVTVGPRRRLRSVGLTADQCNWLIDAPPTDWRDCQIKIRANSEPVPGCVRTTGPDTLEARFTEPQEAVTPGQAVVCYDGDELIGGGWIVRAVGGHD